TRAAVPKSCWPISPCPRASIRGRTARARWLPTGASANSLISSWDSPPHPTCTSATSSFSRRAAARSRRGTPAPGSSANSPRAAGSKNDYDKAVEPFEKHAEMALRMKDFASFKANWQPKSENIRQIASELNLGLDSLVFVDDNPAEIEIVKQFVPEVGTLLLGPDPSEYVAQLQDARWFEPKSLTAEDLERSGQYRQEAQRQELLSS